MNVAHSNRAIGDKFFAHHPSKLTDWIADHSLLASRLICLLILMPGESLKICLHCVHQHPLYSSIFVGDIQVV